jgi:hypothetical protein
MQGVSVHTRCTADFANADPSLLDKIVAGLLFIELQAARRRDFDEPACG